MLTVLDRLGPAMLPFIGTSADRRLNLGCGRQLWPGWINIDRTQQSGADLAVDLEHGILPFETETVDCILACHVLEHIVHLMPLMRECSRVLRPGGHLIAVTPYIGSDDAWEDPTHVRAFSEKSWMYFDRRTYQGEGHAGCYDSGVDYVFEVQYVHLVPMPAWMDAAKTSPNNLEYERRTHRNVIQEMRTALRKVAA